jgi:outer membrane lipoprotein SlyB
MERTVKYLAALVGLAVALGLLGASVSRAVAREEVKGVETRVTRLEAQRTEDVRRQDEIRQDVKEILRELRELKR